MRRVAWLLAGCCMALAQTPAPTHARAVKSLVKIYDRATGESKIVFSGTSFYQAPNSSPDDRWTYLNSNHSGSWGI